MHKTDGFEIDKIEWKNVWHVEQRYSVESKELEKYYAEDMFLQNQHFFQIWSSNLAPDYNSIRQVRLNVRDRYMLSNTVCGTKCLNLDKKIILNW